MMKRVILLGVVVLSGCSQDPIGKSYIGTKFVNKPPVVGGITHGHIGSKTRDLFGQKRDLTMEAFQDAAEHNQRGTTTRWHDNASWSYGTYTPYATIQTKDGVYCRKINETVTMNNRTYSNSVQACRDASGFWVVE